jgi:hypothetical protein
MEKVNVIYQSEAILADPSNYWISVINVGRHFRLDDVMGPDMQDSEGVGIVIGRLMKVADVMGLEPSSISFLGRDRGGLLESKLVERFFDETLPSMTKPKTIQIDSPSLSLQKERESAAHKTENDEFFLLDDPKVCCYHPYISSEFFGLSLGVFVFNRNYGSFLMFICDI